MNVWQYSRWVYLIGRSIKYKNLEPSEREAFITFVDEMLKTRPHMKSQINIKKGLNKDWKIQNDYSLGKMIQTIGRNLKNLTLKEEEKILCDRLFFSTDKRRYMTYNEYQALDGKNVFISPDESLKEAVENCTPYSVIILSDGNWEENIEVSVEGTKITSEGNAVITGELKVSANNSTVENVTIKSNNPVSIESDDKLIGIMFNKVNAEKGIVVETEVKNFDIKDSVIGKIEFNNSGENIFVTGSEINGDVVFNDELNGVEISENIIKSQSGIVLNGYINEDISIEGNKFNVE